jgi:hypothetical protein
MSPAMEQDVPMARRRCISTHALDWKMSQIVILVEDVIN